MTDLKLRQARLEALSGNIRSCRICRDAPRAGAQPLPHEPRPVCVPSAKARILIAGQAPGTRVHASGVPFTDPSGDRLRSWMGITSETFYDAEKVSIVPMGFCFPGLDSKGGDLPPRRECADNWHQLLLAEMSQIDLILIIGIYAQKFYLGEKRQKTLTATVQSWRTYFDAQSRSRVITLPHPSWRNNAWIKRNAWFEEELLPVLRDEVAQRV